MNENVKATRKIRDMVRPQGLSDVRPVEVNGKILGYSAQFGNFFTVVLLDGTIDWGVQYLNRGAVTMLIKRHLK